MGYLPYQLVNPVSSINRISKTNSMTVSRNPSSPQPIEKNKLTPHLQKKNLGTPTSKRSRCCARNACSTFGGVSNFPSNLGWPAKRWQQQRFWVWFWKTNNSLLKIIPSKEKNDFNILRDIKCNDHMVFKLHYYWSSFVHVFFVLRLGSSPSYTCAKTSTLWIRTWTVSSPMTSPESRMREISQASLCKFRLTHVLGALGW